jgi:hypothetical protein
MSYPDDMIRVMRQVRFTYRARVSATAERALLAE